MAKILDFGSSLVHSLFLLLKCIHPFLQQRLIEHLLCPRPCFSLHILSGKRWWTQQTPLFYKKEGFVRAVGWWENKGVLAFGLLASSFLPWGMFKKPSSSGGWLSHSAFQLWWGAMISGQCDTFSPRPSADTEEAVEPRNDGGISQSEKTHQWVWHHGNSIRKGLRHLWVQFLDQLSLYPMQNPLLLSS